MFGSMSSTSGREHQPAGRTGERPLLRPEDHGGCFRRGRTRGGGARTTAGRRHPGTGIDPVEEWGMHHPGRRHGWTRDRSTAALPSRFAVEGSRLHSGSPRRHRSDDRPHSRDTRRIRRATPRILPHARLGSRTRRTASACRRPLQGVGGSATDRGLFSPARSGSDSVPSGLSERDAPRRPERRELPPGE